MDKEFEWSKEKSDRLKRTRGASFEDLLWSGEITTVIDHPTRSGQMILLIDYRNYVWAVPFVEARGRVFLKTLYPSRKYTRIFKGGI